MERRDFSVLEDGTYVAPNFEKESAEKAIAKLPLGVRLSRGVRLSHGVGSEYRRLCDATLSMLLQYRSILEPYERDFARSGPASEDRLAALCAACHDLVMPEWWALSKVGLDLVAPLLGEPEALRATKHYTEAVLTPELIQGPIWRRSYNKPLGYPGDYQVMRYLYNGAAEGHTAYARLVHGVGLEIGAFVPNRMEMMREAIAITVEDCLGETGAIRIASVGCGPAREVMDFLETYRPRAPVRFTLVDHDREALEFASEYVRGTTAIRDGQAEADPLRISVLELIKDRLDSRRLGSQHMIYSVGLFDYFGERVCRRLAAALFDRLEPGGLLVIGNMKAHTSIVWPLEFIADWSLNYRTAEDMLALADLDDAASAELHTEPTGCAISAPSLCGRSGRHGPRPRKAGTPPPSSRIERRRQPRVTAFGQPARGHPQVVWAGSDPKTRHQAVHQIEEPADRDRLEQGPLAPSRGQYGLGVGPRIGVRRKRKLLDQGQDRREIRVTLV